MRGIVLSLGEIAEVTVFIFENDVISVGVYAMYAYEPYFQI